MEEQQESVNKFAQSINVQFKDINQLLQAFTHRSYLNEHRDFPLPHNERLEFLGDAVLELVTTRFLFDEYPDRPEGELTAIRASLVNTISIADAGAKLKMADYLLLSKGESKDTGRARQYILANTFEAVIGAIYLDQGYDTAKDFIATHILSKTTKIVAEGSWLDAKSYFQELAQEREAKTPDYRTISEIGPDHAKEFTVGVYLGADKVAEGKGHSKQEAEVAAARKAIKTKGWT
jgi:ribonuclease III